MRLSKIEIDAFRNLREISFTPSAGVNMIYGENAQGKTNLIEAIWLLTGSKSFRGAKENELLPVGGTYARLSGEYEGSGRENQTKILFGEKKKILHNGVDLPSLPSLAGTFYAVVFSPFHLSLVKGGPVERRRFLDTTIFQLKPRYYGVVSEYQRLLQQRNALLRDAAYHSGLLDTLEVWDQSYAHAASLMMRTRRSYVERLAGHAQRIYEGVSNGKEQLSVTYLSSCEEETPAGVYSALQLCRGTDLAQGVSTVGPHRDDLELKVNGLLARTYGSQGQQRSVVLALKLAECALVEEVTGESPVVLLDDVLSELDGSRQEYLTNKLLDRQIFLTCCEPGAARQMDRCAAVEMKNGRLVSTE